MMIQPIKDNIVIDPCFSRWMEYAVCTSVVFSLAPLFDLPTILYYTILSPKASHLFSVYPRMDKNYMIEIINGLSGKFLSNR